MDALPSSSDAMVWFSNFVEPWTGPERMRSKGPVQPASLWAIDVVASAFCCTNQLLGQLCWRNRYLVVVTVQGAPPPPHNGKLDEI